MGVESMLIYIFNLYFVLLLLFLSRSVLSKNTIEKEATNKITIGIVVSRNLLVFGFIIMFLISGLRYNVGTDYYEYTLLFQSIAESKEAWYTFQIEPIFTLMTKFISLFSKNPLWIYITTSFFIILFILMAAVKGTELYDLAVFLFIALGFYTSSFNIVRQWMAASVILFSYTLLANNQQKDFFKCVLLACCCHYSALVVLPTYFFIRKPHKNAVRSLLMMFGVVLYSATDHIIAVLQMLSLKVGFFNKYYKHLILGENIGGSIFVLPMFCLITYIIVLLARKNYKYDESYMEIYINILTIGFVISLIGQKLMVFNRLQYFFVSILIIIIPQIVYLLKKRDRIILYLACVFMGTLFMIYSLNLNGGHPLPYQTIFS